MRNSKSGAFYTQFLELLSLGQMCPLKASISDNDPNHLMSTFRHLPLNSACLDTLEGRRYQGKGFFIPLVVSESNL
jgi:hypothetical protein